MPFRLMPNSITLNDLQPTYRNSSFSQFSAVTVNFRSSPVHIQHNEERHTKSATEYSPLSLVSGDMGSSTNVK